MNPWQSTHDSENCTSPEGNTLKASESLFAISHDESAIFPLLHEHTAMDALQQLETCSRRPSGNAFSCPIQEAIGTASTSAIEPGKITRTLRLSFLEETNSIS
jgi:hypothetical protein